MSSLHMAAATHDDVSLTAGSHNLEASSTQLSGDQPAANPPSSSSEDVPDMEPTVVDRPHSQPMTTTGSLSTQPSFVGQPGSSPGTPDLIAGLSYGTRSRNRGAPRPNYAEDRDIDTELDATASSSSKNAMPKRVSSLNPNDNRISFPGSENDKGAGPGVSTRRAQTVANTSTGKEAIPGTSTFSANPNAGVGSKKRKQPGSNQTAPPSIMANGATSSKSFIASASQSEGSRVSNMMTFDNSGGYLKNGKLEADDGTLLSANDHVYLICEPPGEPYYLARIMEFLPAKSDPNGFVESLRVNWFYRPRDIQRKTCDMRVVFASMHSDTCPLSSLRGKCRILHRSEIENLEEYKRTKDSFWFEKMYDRYIQRYYEVVPTTKVINVPEHVKKVLDERWKYVLVEQGRRAELTSQVKTCKRCGRYAANSDSVDCAVCKNTYHMHCVRPVLLKKPARGFAWACAACSRAHEKQREARNTPMGHQPEPEPEAPEEEEDDAAAGAAAAGAAETTRRSSFSNEEIQPATSEQISQAKLWPFRYLGVHCRVEDALDYDDRIYPRASSRLGTRHQANVNLWYGHPVEYVKGPETKRKNAKGPNKKDTKLSKDAIAAIESDKSEKAKRPKWVMDEPFGYVRRGEDEPVIVSGKEVHTAQLQFKMPDASQLPARGEDDAPGSSLGDAEREKFVDDYMKEAKKVATSRGIEQYSTNFLDKALKLLYEENFSAELALARLKQIHRYKDLKEPYLRPEEVKMFESGVARYGSELRHVTKHVGTVPHRNIVRYYYMWKKTPQGRRIWGNYEGRKSKQAAKKTDTVAKLVDDVADDHDDSAFDNDKAFARKRGFTCKFCSSRSSRQWRRAPGVSPGTTQPVDVWSKREKGLAFTVALCQRCAVLWRKYGIHWEDADEVAKRIVQVGSKSWRRRDEEQLLAQLLTSSESDVKINSTTAATAASLDLPVTAGMTKDHEYPKKKPRVADKETNGMANHAASEQAAAKRKLAEKPNEPPPLNPEPPKIRVLPCAVCKKMEPTGDQHLTCRECRLTVHRACYGVPAFKSSTKWFCDMCSNDKNPVVSTSYGCVLCPVAWTDHELMELPKVSHKKKSEREKEKEKREKDMVQEAMKLYRQRQEDQGKPLGPREPLKRTDGNNWVHVTCAVWTPEVKFGNSKELEPAESLATIPSDRFRETCKICKTNKGACVPCHNATCNARFHVGCADQAGYKMGFDITPVKSSRRDAIHTIKLGEELGAATPVIWCPHHPVSNVVHELSETTEVDDLNSLQLYVQTYKQADLTLTGTVRKAAHVQQSVGVPAHSGVAGAPHRRTSSTTASQQKNNVQPAGKVPRDNETEPQHGDAQVDSQYTAKNDRKRECHRCQTNFSPKWWVCSDPRQLLGTHGTRPERGGDEQFSIQPGDSAYECHKCHFKKETHDVEPTDFRYAPRTDDRSATVPVSSGSEFSQHSLATVAHAHPTQATHALPAPPSLSRPPPLHGTGEWCSEYDQRPGDLVNHPLRNGPAPAGADTSVMPLGRSSYHTPAPPPPPPPSRPPPAPAPHHVNGYHTGVPAHHHQGALTHATQYESTIPPPPPPPMQSYPTHQSPYGPIAVASGGPHPPATSQQPYKSGASPPAPQFSPPASFSALAPPPPGRMYPSERTIAPNHSPPSLPAHSVEPQQSPGPALQKPQLGAPVENPRPESAGRGTGQTSGSAASASPSLKNLLL